MSMPRTVKKKDLPADAVDGLSGDDARWAQGDHDTIHKKYLAMIKDRIVGNYYRVSGDLAKPAPGVTSAIYVKDVRGPFVKGSFVEISGDGAAKVIGEFLVHASVVDLTTPIRFNDALPDPADTAAPAAPATTATQEDAADAESKKTPS